MVARRFERPEDVAKGMRDEQLHVNLGRLLLFGHSALSEKQRRFMITQMGEMHNRDFKKLDRNTLHSLITLDQPLAPLAVTTPENASPDQVRDALRKQFQEMKPAEGTAGRIRGIRQQFEELLPVEQRRAAYRLAGQLALKGRPALSELEKREKQQFLEALEQLKLMQSRAQRKAGAEPIVYAADVLKATRLGHGGKISAAIEKNLRQQKLAPPITLRKFLKLAATGLATIALATATTRALPAITKAYQAWRAGKPATTQTTKPLTPELKLFNLKQRIYDKNAAFPDRAWKRFINESKNLNLSQPVEAYRDIADPLGAKQNEPQTEKWQKDKYTRWFVLTNIKTIRQAQENPDAFFKNLRTFFETGKKYGGMLPKGSITSEQRYRYQQAYERAEIARVFLEEATRAYTPQEIEAMWKTAESESIGRKGAQIYFKKYSVNAYLSVLGGKINPDGTVSKK